MENKRAVWSACIWILRDESGPNSKCRSRRIFLSSPATRLSSATWTKKSGFGTTLHTGYTDGPQRKRLVAISLKWLTKSRSHSRRQKGSCSRKRNGPEKFERSGRMGTKLSAPTGGPFFSNNQGNPQRFSLTTPKISEKKKRGHCSCVIS